LTERGVKPDLVLGHSLGEISALSAAGIVTPEDAIRIAAKRGELMEAAAMQTDGAMLAVVIQERSRLLEWLGSAEIKERAVVANDNAPTQIVLSGERSALLACATFVIAEKLGRCQFLPVSGPWHSRYLSEAALCFDGWLRQLPWHAPTAPMLFNATASNAPTLDVIPSLISSMLDHQGRWRECMARVRQMNPQALFEVGPGRVLSGLARANGLLDPMIVPANNLRGIAQIDFRGQ
jgi:[acyl-carrier-protein] S-malonyltransferase